MFWSSFGLVLCLVLSQSAGAQAQADEPANALPPADFSGKQSEQWMAVQSQLITARSKVENQEKIVEALIEKKSRLKGAELAAKIEALKEAHIELIRVINYYNNLNSDFETKFPEKGAAPGRVYKRIDPASIQKMESKMTLEGRLKRLNAKIKSQYGQTSEGMAPKSVDVKNKKVNKNNASPVMKSEDIQVTDQIILQK